MCQYCGYGSGDGWDALIEYDDVYQNAVIGADDESSTYGFHESWDDLSDELEG